MRKPLSCGRGTLLIICSIPLLSILLRPTRGAELGGEQYGEWTKTFRKMASADPEAQQDAAHTLIAAQQTDVVPLLVTFLRESIKDPETDVWRRAYVALERSVRLRQQLPNLDDGLLRMRREKTDRKVFAGIPFIWIPKGWFVAGTEIDSPLVLWGVYPDSCRTEVKKAYVDGFWIAETEVTQLQVEKLGVREATFTYRSDRVEPKLADLLPVQLNESTEISRISAGLKDFLDRLTEAVKKEGSDVTADFPTELQWERAARGDDGRLYPWGNALARGKKDLPELVAQLPLRTRPVGAIPVDTSPYGVKDMVGNVSEVLIRSGPPVYYEWRLADRTVVQRGCGVYADGHAEPLVAYRSRNGPVGIRLVLNPADCKSR